jgi:hypothetical protein
MQWLWPPTKPSGNGAAVRSEDAPVGQTFLSATSTFAAMAKFLFLHPFTAMGRERVLLIIILLAILILF